MSRIVYIASALQNASTCRALSTLLQQDGHRVSSRWHLTDSPGDSATVDASLHPAERARCVESNRKDMRHADTLVFLHHRACRSSFVEAGIAIAWGHRVVLVGEPSELPLMLSQYGVTTVPSILDVVDELRDRR